MIPALLLLLAGCEAGDNSPGPRIHVPGKDDVALVDGEPLTLSAFVSIRQQLKNPSKENAFWVGVATLAIRKSRDDLKDPAPFEIALFALGMGEATDAVKAYFGDPLPTSDDARKRLDQLVSRYTVQRNPQLLSGL